MDEFNPGFVLLIAILVLIAFIVAGVAHTQHQRELQNFARRWRGQVLPGGFFGSSEVNFQLGGVSAKLSYSSNGDDGMLTHLDLRVTPGMSRLELRHQVPADRIKKLIGLQDLEIGSPEFDALFIIQGNNPRQVRELLTEPLQAAVLRLANWQNMHAPDLHLHLSGGKLRITKHRAIHNEIELSRFVQFCSEIHRCLEALQQGGIEFVEQAPRILVAETQCQVCGDPLHEKIVFCAKCKTPHHLDCWQYFGSCAVYGCGQKRFVAAQGTVKG